MLAPRPCRWRWLSRLRGGLSKSAQRVTESITGIFTKKPLDQTTLNELEDALIQADRLKSQFISLVSYELRSPLQNIIGFSEFLENPKVGPLNPKQVEYAGF